MLRVAITALMLSMLTGCPSSHGAASDAGPIVDCALSVGLEVRRPGGAYAPIAEGGQAELVLGFQGFKFAYVRARLDRVPPSTVATFEYSLDGDAPRSTRVGGMQLTSEGGGWVSSPEQIFFNDDPLPSLIDRGCAITMIVGDATCSAAQSGHVTLHYQDGCVQAPDGGLTCTDAGPP
jgi:hypothetical protein